MACGEEYDEEQGKRCVCTLPPGRGLKDGADVIPEWLRQAPVELDQMWCAAEEPITSGHFTAIAASCMHFLPRLVEVLTVWAVFKDS